MFPNRLYVELQRHGLAEERVAEEGLIDLAYAKRLPLVATNDVHFGAADMYEAHDALLCIADGAFVSQDDRRRLTREHRFKSAAEMTAQFADLPEAIENTIEIAKRCAFRPKKRDPILPQFVPDSGRSPEEEIQLQAEAGLAKKLALHGRHAEEAGLSRADRVRTRYHHQDALRGLLSDRLRLYEMDTRARHAGRRARFRRDLAGGLGAGHHQSRSDPLRLVVRALSQSRTHLHAGLRHRFLSGAARRSREVCARQIWPRQGCPYHRAGFSTGACRSARCRPCSSDAAWACRSHRQTHPQSARQAYRSARCHRWRTAPATDRRTGAAGRKAVLHRAEDRRACTAMPPPIPPAW